MRWGCDIVIAARDIVGGAGLLIGDSRSPRTGNITCRVPFNTSETLGRTKRIQGRGYVVIPWKIAVPVIQAVIVANAEATPVR